MGIIKDIWEDIEEIEEIILSLMSATIILITTSLILFLVIKVIDSFFEIKPLLINYLEISSQIGILTIFIIFVFEDLYHYYSTDQYTRYDTQKKFVSKLYDKISLFSVVKIIGRIIGNIAGIFLGLLGVAILDSLSYYRCPNCNYPLKRNAKCCGNCKTVLRRT